jgi:N-acetylmuramoyl-L-alanine amidase
MKIIKRAGFYILLSISAFSLLLSVSEARNSGTSKRIEVKGIRSWSNPTYTRIVIDLSSATTYKYHLLKKDPSIKKPQRLFIDISNATRSQNLTETTGINDGILKRVRTGQYNKKTVRVVLDIEAIEDYKVFHLNDPFRIVVDVTSKGRPSSPEVAVSRKEQPAASKMGTKISRIVIDPGHGGKDPGAIGKRGLKEKDINLKLAKKLRNSLRKSFKGDIILTRERDIFLPLEERTAIANMKNADIFLSIHANASPNRKARGIETYYLNFTTDEEAMRVAARENATSIRHMSDLQFILTDLMKTAKTNESVRMAANIQESIVSTLKKRYRRIQGNGIKGAPFYVLVGTQMPSVLIEVSFISNPEEETRLRKDAYLNGIAKGITAGVLQYIKGASTSEL